MELDNERRNIQLIAFLGIALALAVLLEILRLSFTEQYQFASSLDIAQGIGEVPYQYRVLFAKLSLLLTEHFGVLGFSDWCSLFNVISSICIVYSVFKIFIYFGISYRAAQVLALCSLLPIGYCLLVDLNDQLSSLYYIYDLPGVAFFTAGLLCLLNNEIRKFAFIFVIGTLNRETTLILLFPYLNIYNSRFGRLPIIGLGILGSSWIAVKYYLFQVYSLNPGRAVHLAVMNNIEALSSFSIFGLVFVGGGSWILLLYSRRSIPRDLASLLSCLLPFFCVVLMAGSILELRVFLEITPLLWVAGIVSFFAKNKWLNKEIRCDDS